MKLTPHTAYYLRLLSVVFGILSIFLIYKIGKELFDTDTGLISALILALSVFHIQYSQEIRSYMMVVVLILLSYYLLIRLCRRPKLIYFALYIFINTLLIYTHFLGWFILFAQNLYYLLRFKFDINRIKPLIILNVIILTLAMPWLNILISRFFYLQTEFWVSEPTLLSIPQTILIYSGTYTIFGIILLFLFCVLAFISFMRYKERKFMVRWSYNHENYLLWLWMWIPILIPFIISVVSAPIFIIRLTIGASLAFYLIVAHGLSLVDKKSIKVGILILIIVMSSGNIGIYYSETNKEQWKEATDFVESEASTGDLLIFHAGFGLDRAFNFYAKRDDLVKRRFPAIGYEINKNPVNELNPLLKNKENVWLILSHSRDKENLIIKNLTTDFDLIQRKEYVSNSFNSHDPYVGVEILQFQRRK
jgi:mannosyltransferase